MKKEKKCDEKKKKATHHWLVSPLVGRGQVLECAMVGIRRGEGQQRLDPLQLLRGGLRNCHGDLCK